MINPEGLRFIPAGEIPAGARKPASWVLKAINDIPSGMAWMIREGEVDSPLNTMKCAFHRYMRQGKIPKNYRLIQRKDSEGKLTLYIVNSAEADKP